MNIDLTPYKHKRICVAVSGGKDSMALLHFLKVHGEDFGISLSALNCDHGIRGEESARDSAFVAAYCGANCIPLHSFRWSGDKFEDENAARFWRLQRYKEVIASGGADLIATAHHMNDNTETVLFNLARGTSLSGLTGITDTPELNLVRPLIACTREEIDDYVEANKIPFVTDSTNLSEEYTRNKIRLSVLPALESAVHGAVKNIYRFSRLAAEDEEYFARKAAEVIADRRPFGYVIKPCGERVIFKRAAHFVVAAGFGKIDYTAEHFERLFELQCAPNGKKFEFLGLTAFKEEGGIAICVSRPRDSEDLPFLQNYLSGGLTSYCGILAVACYEEDLDAALSRLDGGHKDKVKILKFDADKIPDSAVIRFKRAGDKFTKFGGGTKSLGDYLTDVKIPQSLRSFLPLVCDGGDVLIIGGVEISEKIKVTENTERVGFFVCPDPIKQ